MIGGLRLGLRPDRSLPGWAERLLWLFHGFVEPGIQPADVNMTLSLLTRTGNKNAHVELLEEAERLLSQRFSRSARDADCKRQMYSRFEDLSRYWPSKSLVDVVSRFVEDGPGSGIFLPLDGGCLALNFEGGHAQLLVDPEACANAMQTVVSACILACAVSLPLVSGVLLHGAGVVRNDRAFLFLGPSGAGKSTVAWLSKSDSTILSDDAVVLTAEDHRYRLHASPFTQTENEMATPQRIGTNDLAAVLFLNQGHDVRLESVNRAQALIRIFNSHVHFLGFLPRDRLRQTFELCLGLCRSVPAYELTFAKNSEFWDCLEELPLP